MIENASQGGFVQQRCGGGGGGLGRGGGGLGRGGGGGDRIGQRGQKRKRRVLAKGNNGLVVMRCMWLRVK
jgi:hypothetical protein